MPVQKSRRLARCAPMPPGYADVHAGARRPSARAVRVLKLGLRRLRRPGPEADVYVVRRGRAARRIRRGCYAHKTPALGLRRCACAEAQCRGRVHAGLYGPLI